jgi:hypothetical protein
MHASNCCRCASPRCAQAFATCCCLSISSRCTLRLPVTTWANPPPFALPAFSFGVKGRDHICTGNSRYRSLSRPKFIPYNANLYIADTTVTPAFSAPTINPRPRILLCPCPYSESHQNVSGFPATTCRCATSDPTPPFCPRLLSLIDRECCVSTDTPRQGNLEKCILRHELICSGLIPDILGFCCHQYI